MLSQKYLDKHDPEIESFVQKLWNNDLKSQVGWYRMIMYVGVALPFVLVLFRISPEGPLFPVVLFFLIFYSSIVPVSLGAVTNVANDIILKIRVIEKEKFSLQNSFSHFLELQKNDVEQEGIDIVELTNITEEIKKISQKIQEFQKLLSIKNGKIIKKNERNESRDISSIVFSIIQWHYSDIIKEFIQSQKEWLTKMIPVFSQEIQAFLSHHTLELAELEKQIQSQEIATENEDGKAALELSRISLQEHLKELEKVRM